MTAPTVALTVDLSSLGGAALSGVTVTAKLDRNEVYNGFVIAKPVTGVTVNGVVVLNVFPNAPSPTGLGTTGSVLEVSAVVPGGRTLKERALVPNTACRLENIRLFDEPVPLDAAQTALLQAQAAVTTAAGSAAAAATSAAAAAASASTATTSALAAIASAAGAASSAAAASSSASTASTGATNAANSATAAALSATSAASSAAQANTSAINAASSVNSASTYATLAGGFASDANTARGLASGSATSAAFQATNAATSATAAAASATAAATSATNASTSAGQSQTSATNAAVSAAAAAASATVASTAATSVASGVTAAAASAAAAAASAASAATSAAGATSSATTALSAAATATAAAGVASSALIAINAVYSPANLTAAQLIMLGYVTTAQGAVSQASASAASAASVAQQDLSGVSGLPLHRSPNAIVAQFIYDTSKDGDGGAWIERMASQSWMTETLSGNWLGSQTSEALARIAGGTVGPELLSNTSLDTTAGWTGNLATLSASSGTLSVVNTGSNGSAYSPVTTVVGKMYRVRYLNLRGSNVVQTITKSDTTAMFGTNYVTLGTGVIGLEATNSPFFVATATTTYIHVGSSTSTVGTIATLDDISVKEVTALASSGDFYNDAADGKHKRVWKNVLQNTGFTGGTAGTIGAGAVAPTNWNLQGTGTVAFSTSTRPGAYLGQNNIRFAATAARAYTAPSTVAAVTVGQTWIASFYVETLHSGAATIGTLMTHLVVGATVTYRKNGVAALSGDAVATGDFIEFIWVITSSGNLALNYGVAASVGSSTADITFSPLQVELVSSTTSVATVYENKAAGAGSTSEVFRGNKAKFPRLSAIVAEAARVVIYDLEEPGRPMWMVFASSGSNNAIVRGSAVSGIAAVQGQLFIGMTGGLGMSTVDFAKDRAWLMGQASTFAARTVANRNDTSVAWGSGANVQTSTTFGVVNSTVNAISATLMPDAPVDPVSSLQIPTVAAFTGGGISVFQNDGNVRNSSSTSNFTGGQITPKLLVAVVSGTANTNYATAPGALGASFALSSLFFNTAPYFGGAIPGLSVSSPLVAGRSTLVNSNGGSVGAVNITRLNEATPAASMTAYITSAYSTGWMVGDIRRCLLADTIAGTIAGTELTPQGVFPANSTAGWATGLGTTAASTLTAAGGQGTITVGNSEVNARYVTSYNVVQGRTYRVRATGNLSAHTLTAGVTTASNGAGGTSQVSFGATAGAFSFDSPFVATFTGTAYFYIGFNGTGVNGDTIVFTENIQECVGDRSEKNKPSTVNGTLALTAVATAAQLAFYSGWSAANYVQEAYHADLDFGTAGFALMPWLGMPAAAVDVNHPLSANKVTSTTPIVYNSGGGDSISMAGGDATCTRGAGTPWGFIYAVNGSTSNFLPASRYKVTFDVASYTGTGAATMQVFSGDVNIGNPMGTIASLSGTTVTTYVNNASANMTGVTLLLSGGTAGDTVTVRNMVAQELLPVWVVDRSAATGPYWRAGMNGLGRLVGEVYDGTTTRTVTGTVSYFGVGTILPEMSLTSAGALTIKVNGTQVAQTTGASLLTLNNASAVLTIGNRRDLDSAFYGSIALARIGATVPFAEQSKIAYSQENAMFQPAAQVALPDIGGVVDRTYDDMLERLKISSAANESSFSGFVRTASSAAAAGSITKASLASGIKLVARSTTNPGVDVTFASQNLREQLRRRAEDARAQAGQALGRIFDFDATASQTDFPLAVGWEVSEVMAANVPKREGSTKDWQRKYNGFYETTSFNSGLSVNTWVQLIARRAA